eukprot:14287789-Alexandrium_andersonii.AAC.1
MSETREVLGSVGSGPFPVRFRRSIRSDRRDLNEKEFGLVHVLQGKRVRKGALVDDGRSCDREGTA